MNTKTNPSLLSDILISNFGEIVNDIFTEDKRSTNPDLRPSIEFVEEHTHYKLAISLPGMNKEDISIKIEGDILKITGERKKPDSKGKTLVSEMRYGKYSRSLKMPKNINSTDIQAKYVDGILNVTLDKKEVAQPKEINIL